MPLRVSCDDHHFASSVEKTSFRCRPPDGKKIEEISMEVSDNAGKVIHKAEWNTGTIPATGKFPWDGEDNQSPAVHDSSGTVVKQYAHPLGAPYTARFRAKLAPAAPVQQRPDGVSPSSDGATTSCPLRRRPGPADNGQEYQDGSAKVWVLYRELKLEAISWLDVYKAVSGLADGSFSTAGTLNQKKMWLVYKLNELGYAAGPVVDPPVPEPILRALFDYTQAHTELPKIVHYPTLTAGAAGACNWGWRALWQGKFGTLDQLCTGGVMPDGDELLNCLKGDENKRSDFLETPAALLDRSKETRVIFDHDLHYLNKDFVTYNANVEYDKEFLNPFCWPFRIKVRLVSQKDARATKAGIDAPKGVGPVECNWFAYDFPEDTSVIPPPVQSQSKLKSRAKAYIDETHAKLAGNHGDEVHALDNCPVELGGIRPADPGDMSPYFLPVQNPQAFPGGSAIYFKGSYIAGDNYFVQAALSLDGVPNAGPIKQEHRCLTGLADAFQDPEPLEQTDAEQPLVAQSGRMTLWRRQHVLREILWDDRNYPAINWPPVVENYRAAHVILVPPAAPPIKVDALFTDPAVRNRLVDSVLDGGATGPVVKEFVRQRGAKAFSPSHLYPIPFPTLADVEALYAPTALRGADERWVNYSGFLKTSLGQWPGYSDLVLLSRALREATDELKLGPGIIVLRANFFGTPDFATLLPADINKATKKKQAEFGLTRGVCTGMDYGVVMLDRENSAKYEECYLVTHEISHCLFGSHPFEVASTDDHDRGDANCLMYYNIVGKGNGGLSDGWAVRETPQEYGLNVTFTGARNSQQKGGKLSSPFKLKIESGNEVPGSYVITGSIKELQKALRSAKFTPDSSVTDDPTVTILLEGAPVRPTLTGGGSLPFTVRRRISEGSCHPFESLQIGPARPRDGEPRFCGKCLLKLRGWRVGPTGSPPPLGVPAVITPARSRAVPINGRMRFTGYSVAEGDVMLSNGTANITVTFGLDAKDPGNNRQQLGPFDFAHNHEFRWQSSTGNLDDLQGMLTREIVKWRSRTQGPPFNSYADPDQQFAQAGGDAKDGVGSDKHSMRLPAFICRRTPAGEPVAGTIIGEQCYQYCLVPGYSRNAEDWVDIPDSHFLLEKSVYHNGKHWVMSFKKTNRAPQNTVPFQFEIHYKIGPLPTIAPFLIKNRFAGATANAPVFGYLSDGRSIAQEVWAAGDNTLDVKYNGTNSQRTTLEILKKKGYAISGSPTP